MPKRWLIQRRTQTELGPAAARLLVLGYLIAAGMGVVAGILWIGWHLLQ
jgi:hypothetical protein